MHIRRGVAGLDEALKLAAATKAPLHVVHINSSGVEATREMLQMITDARNRGMDVTTEAYPYAAGMTEIQSANLDEYQSASDDRIARLEWPRTGERLTRETFEKYRQTGGPVVLHTNTEEMVTVAIRSPLTMIASDAYWENGTGHPRTTGTYSKVLGRYVRESALADVDGCHSKDDVDARTASAGTSAGHAGEGAAARGRRRRHHDCRRGAR